MMDAPESQQPAVNQDGSNKRPLDDTGEPGAKRVKTDGENGLQNGPVETKTTISDESKASGVNNALGSEMKGKDEVEAGESETKSLPKGTAPVKQE